MTIVRSAALSLALAGCGQLGLSSIPEDRRDQAGLGEGPGGPGGADSAEDEEGSGGESGGDGGSDDGSTSGGDDTGEEPPPDPEPPALTDVSFADDDGVLTVSFRASDPDDDLSGGEVQLTLQGAATSFAIPGDLASFNPGGVSSIQVEYDRCDAGSSYSVSLQVRDAAGNGSTTVNTSHTLSGDAIRVDSSAGTDWGDDYPSLGSGVDIGTIYRPTIICGHIYAATNDGYAFLGDVDFLDLRAGGGGSHTFILSWEAGGSDYDLSLYDGQGYGMAESLYADPETITQPLTASQYYILRIGGWSGGSGRYWIEVL